MKLIVGLGNPEAQYMMTRHNAGFWVTDKVATKYGADGWTANARFFAHTASVNINHQKVLLAQPSTYMNRSGQAVLAIAQFYKIEHADILVVHDDVSIPLGKLRVQFGAGAGGQHGIEDIIQRFGGAKDFTRIKFGVGPDPGGSRRADFVLSAVAPDQIELKNKMIEIAAEAAELWVRDGWKEAANKFNGLDYSPPPPPPATPLNVDEATTNVQSMPDKQ